MTMATTQTTIIMMMMMMIRTIKVYRTRIKKGKKGKNQIIIIIIIVIINDEWEFKILKDEKFSFSFFYRNKYIKYSFIIVHWMILWNVISVFMILIMMMMMIELNERIIFHFIVQVWNRRENFLETHESGGYHIYTNK